MAPCYATRSPNVARIRSPPRTVALPKYSPGGRRARALRRKPSFAFTDDSEIEEEEEQEWVDAPTNSQSELVSLRSKLQEILPSKRPGFLEMNEATATLSNLVKTFSGSSGSLSLNASPYKTHEHAIASPRSLCGIMEADEPTSFSLSSPPAHLGRKTRERLISLASMVSTEANSSFEDSEELQKLLDSIMAADLGNDDTPKSSGGSGGGDLALLSPFGSPEEYREVCNTGCQDEEPQKAMMMPPPPKFLLNDRPISPPDSSVLAEEEEDAAGDATLQHQGQPFPTIAQQGLYRAWKPSGTHDDSGYASFSLLDGHHAQ